MAKIVFGGAASWYLGQDGKRAVPGGHIRRRLHGLVPVAPLESRCHVFNAMKCIFVGMRTSVYILLLSVYSALLVVAHMVLAALVCKGHIRVPDFAPLAHALAILDYQHKAWLSVKLLLAPVVVLIFPVLS